VHLPPYGIHETLLGMTVLGIGVSLAVSSLPSVRRLPRVATRATGEVI